MPGHVVALVTNPIAARTPLLSGFARLPDVVVRMLHAGLTEAMEERAREAGLTPYLRAIIGAMSRALALAVVLAIGCRPSTTVPIQTVSYARPGVARPRCLLVMLPGQGDSPGDFADNGFIDDVHRAGNDVDVIAVDAHFGYYVERSLVRRLMDDVITPARARGYQRVWVLGISVGGAGAISLARQQPEAVDGVFLLAPYLGDAELIEGVARAGGLMRWSVRDPTDIPQLGLRWLQGYGSPGTQRPPLFLGFGADDRFARALRLLAQELPADRVATIPGGHRWSIWRDLWARMVRSGSFRDACRNTTNAS